MYSDIVSILHLGLGSQPQGFTITCDKCNSKNCEIDYDDNGLTVMCQDCGNIYEED